MKLITTDLLNDLKAQAAASPRRRMNHNVHAQLSDPVQRLFVAARPDSYFRPHRHPDKWEFALIISGRFDLLVFNDTGRLTARHTLGPGTESIGIELEANTWHTWLALTDDAVFFETKQGPFDPQTISEFAPWSPAEGEADAPDFFTRLRESLVGDMVAWR